MRSKFRVLGAMAVILPLLAGCAVNPATGQQNINFMSADEEARIGREEHPKIVRSYGGEYKDRALADYVDRIGQNLARHSDSPDQHYTFTVLDSPVVNAFAVPGGYVYITRGLLALAENEAEVAGVLGHEIGHICAHHSAQQQSRATLANIGVTLLGVLIGVPGVSEVAGMGAEVAMAGFSREQESEADTLGFRYLTRTGYHPMGMASFFAKLEADTRLSATIAGHPDSADQFSIMQSHPRTLDRIQVAMASAGVTEPPPNARVARDEYLHRIDGLAFGDSPAQGIVRGHTFLHPDLRIRFEVPDGFKLTNGDKQVVAKGPGNAAIAFDIGDAKGQSMAAYVRDTWGKRLGLKNVETLDLNGMEAATGSERIRTNGGEVMDIRLVAATDGRQVYRLTFLTAPDATERLSPELRRTTYSLRPLTREEAASVKPLHMRIVRLRPGDTDQSLAATMAYNTFQLERFRTLNGLLAPTDQLEAGQLAKVVRE